MKALLSGRLWIYLWKKVRIATTVWREYQVAHTRTVARAHIAPGASGGVRIPHL